MPVNLKTIPEPATLPAPPKWWVWSLLLLAALSGATAYAVLNSQTKPEINSEVFWITALFWFSALILRMVWYWGELATAHGWNNEREKAITHETLRGRRFLQVSGMSLHSALREPGDVDGQKHWEALLERTQALKTQPSWWDDKGVRHSRLSRAGDETPEQLLTRIMGKMLDELSHVLASIPVDVSLSLLLESHSCLSDERIEAIWHQSWEASHIRQPVIRVEGSGLAVVDQWLDQRIHERSLLLVVAIQIAPEHQEGTAEAVVGLLLGNPQMQVDAEPLANLHRPEQTHGVSDQDLHYAIKQSLNWVPVSAEVMTSGWLTGVDASWHKDIATGLKIVSSPANIGQDLHDLGSSLGYPGPAAPWLAVACATAGCRRGGEPQFIISGDGLVHSSLWVTAVMPAAGA